MEVSTSLESSVSSEIFKIEVKRNLFVFVSSPDPERLQAMAEKVVKIGGVGLGPTAFALGDDITEAMLCSTFESIHEGDFVHVLRSRESSFANYIITAARER